MSWPFRWYLQYGSSSRAGKHPPVIERSGSEPPGMRGLISANPLSNGRKDLVRQLGILNGTGEHDAAEQDSGLKDRFLPILTACGENLFESAFEGRLEFGRRAGYLLRKSGHGAPFPRALAMPRTQVSIRVGFRSFFCRA